MLRGLFAMKNSYDRARNAGATPKAILETVVYCEDLDAARQFYEGVIGLQLSSSEPGRHLFFCVGDSMLLVFNPQRTRQETVRVGDQVIPHHGPSGASHFAFRVDANQFAAIRANLKDHNVPLESEIEWPGGGHSIYCRDPGGNSVEFATRTLWFKEE
jgi:catechol 2,3-dioxygenase-like lactoylglutathione lyase family enzyme